MNINKNVKIILSKYRKETVEDEEGEEEKKRQNKTCQIIITIIVMTKETI